MSGRPHRLYCRLEAPLKRKVLVDCLQEFCNSGTVADLYVPSGKRRAYALVDFDCEDDLCRVLRVSLTGLWSFTNQNEIASEGDVRATDTHVDAGICRTHKRRRCEGPKSYLHPRSKRENFAGACQHDWYALSYSESGLGIVQCMSCKAMTRSLRSLFLHTFSYYSIMFRDREDLLL